MTSPDSPLLCRQTPPDLSQLWEEFQQRAEVIAHQEPALRPLMQDLFASHANLTGGIAARLARKLAREDMPRTQLEPLLQGILEKNPALTERMACDLEAIEARDPACRDRLQPLLFYKGFLAISTYRIAHQLWLDERHDLAFYFQNLSSEVFGVDIHPAARLGCGVFLDHATSVVIGETSLIEDRVSILHEVTLGGTGKESGLRHPIVRSGVLIGAGSKILGRVEIGTGAKIGAGSVVLEDVPAHQTVAGVPAVIVGEAREPSPADDMDQSLTCSPRRAR